MGHSVQASENGRSKLVFFDEPEFIHALKIAPERREPELDSGVWLILVFSVWSIHDRRAVSDAVACAKHFGGRFKLGVRPYDHPEEMRSWWPQAPVSEIGKSIVNVVDDPPRREIHISGDTSSSPVWLVLKDGQVELQEFGQRPREQLFEMVSGVLG